MNSIPIQMLDLNNNLIKEFTSGIAAGQYIINHKEEFININTNSPSIVNSRINKVLKGKAKTAYGYK